MKIGFTGTREGMTDAQLMTFRSYLIGLNCSVATTEYPVVFHHGVCIGADAKAVAVVHREIFPRRRRIIAHPCDMPRFVDREAVLLSDEVLDAKQPLDRNKDIVDACDVLLACPRFMVEERKSGTWMTIRHARKQKKRIVIFWPDGTVTEENG